MLRSLGHCLAQGDQPSHHHLALDVASSCLKTLCVRAVVAETGLLAYIGHDLTGFPTLPVGVFIDLHLASVPKLHQLLMCSHQARVTGVQDAASRPGDYPTVSFSGLKAACLTDCIGLQMMSGAFAWGFGSKYAKLQDVFQLCEAIDVNALKGSLRLASDEHTMQLLQTYFEHGCSLCM